MDATAMGNSQFLRGSSERLRGLGRRPARILELIDKPEKWVLFDHLPALTYTKGNFCLLGDVAQATTPIPGLGQAS